MAGFLSTAALAFFLLHPSPACQAVQELVKAGSGGEAGKNGVSTDVIKALLGRPDGIIPGVTPTHTSECTLVYHFASVYVFFYVSDLKEPCWALPGYIPSGRVAGYRICY